MNSCTFTGRLVADSNLIITQTGTQLCRFRLASDAGYGEHVKTHYINCTLFGTRGQVLNQYLKKGSQVTVIGELEPPRLYLSQTGETRASQSLVIRDLALMGSKPANQNEPVPTYPSDDHAPPYNSEPHTAIQYNPNDEPPF